MFRDRFLLWGERLLEKGAWYLAPFSWLYGAAIFLRNRLYDWHLLPTIRAKAVVVSVGNIVAGGSGKTPLVHLLAQSFPARKVAILSRGYGTIPDEALLLARKLPQVQVLIGKDRAHLAKNLDVDLILLDDGLQHRRLHRDFDLIIGETTGHYLPWGRLRDSPSRLKETEWVFSGEFAPVVKRILDLHGREIPSIRGWRVALFCGIAKPQRFRKTVEELGAEVISVTYFADHGEIDLSQLPKAPVLLCTEKDAVKLPPTHLPIYYLEIELAYRGDPKRWEKLIEKIEEKIDNHPIV